MEKRRWMSLTGAFLVLFGLLNVKCDNDWNLEEDTSGWIDPHSMAENHGPLRQKTETVQQNSDGTCTKSESDCTIFQEELEKCAGKVERLEKDLEKQKDLYRKADVHEKAFFEQFLRHILFVFENCKDDTLGGHYEADIALSSFNYRYLSHYIIKQNISIQEIHSILSNMLTNIRWVLEGSEAFVYPTDSTAAFLYYLNVVAVALVIILVSSKAVSMLRRINMSFSRFLFLVFLVLLTSSFIISIPWTWWHLYKKKVAERMAAMSKGPMDCTNHGQSFWKTIASYVLVLQRDECQEYFERLEIDPFWEVPPTQAVAVTFIRFFLEPFGHIGRAVRELMVSSFEGLPVVLWFPVYGFIILLLVLVLFCLGRYRIATPFLSIEPARSDAKTQVSNLQGQNRELETTNKEPVRRLDLGARNQMAIDGRGDEMNSQLQLPAAASTTANSVAEDVTDSQNSESFSELKRKNAKTKTKELQQTKDSTSVPEVVSASVSSASDEKTTSESQDVVTDVNKCHTAEQHKQGDTQDKV